MGKNLSPHILILLLTLIPTTVVCQEVILLRSAKTLQKDEILIWESLFFTPLSEKYDFANEEFVELDGTNFNFTSYTMLGYGVFNNLELLLQLPVRRNISTREGVTNSSVGFGDISLQARFALLEGSRRCPAVNIGAMVRFPTGNNQLRPPLGNGTVDLGLSTIATKKIGFFIAHVKLGYIFGGRNSAGINLGNQFLYMLKGDFIVASGTYPLMKELALMVGLNGNLKFEDMELNGDPIENSHKYRPLNIVPMVRWTPWKGFFVRPKVVIPIRPLSTGGTNFATQYVLDLKYSF